LPAVFYGISLLKVSALAYEACPEKAKDGLPKQRAF
jgi:hypothetical protein